MLGKRCQVLSANFDRRPAQTWVQMCRLISQEETQDSVQRIFLPTTVPVDTERLPSGRLVLVVAMLRLVSTWCPNIPRKRVRSSDKVEKSEIGEIRETLDSM
jgi:hypothetical protein